MLPLKITPIPAFSDNYIWLIHNDQYAVAIDPGTAEPVNDFLAQHNLELTQILITHHHWDHVNGLEALQDRWTCPVYAPKDHRIPGRLKLVNEGGQLVLPELNTTFKVIQTPGHTLTHVCYFNDDWLFCGDTLFSLGCGRMFEGTAEQFSQSLNRLRQLPEHTQVYCTHEYTMNNLEFALSIEPDNESLLQLHQSVTALRQANKPSLPSTLKTEKRSNPFLRTAEKSLQQRLSQISGHKINDQVTCFATLRQMKDNF